MDKKKLTKAVIGNMTGYSVGAASAVFFATYRKHSDNQVVETAMSASTVVTGLVVGSMITDQVRQYSDSKIDEIWLWCEQNFARKETTV